jgi:AcrR family transcriptional regulator
MTENRFQSKKGKGRDVMEPSTDKKVKILQAATELFSRYGVRNTTVDQIAKRAGIGKGTIYYYYPDKTAILRDCFTRHLEATRREAVLANQDEPDVLLRLRKILQFIGDEQAHDPLTSMLMEEYKDFRSVEVRECLREAEHGSVEMVNSLLQEGIDKGQFQELPLPLTSFLLVRMWFAYKFDYEGQRQEDQFMQLISQFFKR